MDWAYKEMATADLGDARLDNRLIEIVDDFSRRPDSTIPRASENWARTKAAYRFFDNSKVTPEKILSPHVEQTVRRAMACPMVLVAQDTSEIDLTSHPKTKGTGYLSTSLGRGFFIHTCFAISPTGMPLGVVGQQSWSRPIEEFGKKKQRQKKAIKDKESQRWLDGLKTVEETLPQHPKVLLMADREADIFELFVTPRAANVELLIRARHENRLVEHPEKYLLAAMRDMPVAGTINVSVPRADDRPSRTALLTVRYAALTLKKPKNLTGPYISPTINFILVEEENAPEGVLPIRWLLATTLLVTTLEEAVQIVQWYVFRWRIERFHYVLKSGYRIEKLELETLERMRRALATLSIVSWRLLWLTYQARETPEASCEIVMSTEEWRVLYRIVHKTKNIPPTPPTLREAVRLIARLGGFLARRHDGEPGVKTIWRGMIRFLDVMDSLKYVSHRPRDKCATYG